MPQQTYFFPLGGGLDLITPPIRMPPGRAIGAVNYEAGPKGYRRIDGFERFDGQPKPSAASYWVLNFDAGSAEISEGDTVTDGTSGATGVALIDGVVESGTYGGSDAAGYLVLTAVSGTFGDGNDLEVSAAKKAEADGTAVELAGDGDNHDTWLQDAIETARTAITAIPGSGVIRGIGFLNGDVYAFRDNAGGTAGTMWKATSSGWTQQTFGKEIAFTSGSTEISEQDTIDGLISGASATVERVVLQSGAWSDGDAAGYLVLSGQTGTFQSEGIEVASSGDLATIGGDSTAIALTNGGRYECVETNFFGASNLTRMYFVNSVDTAFEWDGTVLAPIKTGMTTDTPVHVAEHKNHLFLSFAGGSAQHSGIGDPFAWSVVLGASEIGLGQEVTGFSTGLVHSLVILGQNKIAILYGNDSSDFVLEEIRDDAGAIEWTAQYLGSLLYLDDHGVRDLRMARQFGDFGMGELTKLVEPLIRAYKATGVTAKASIRCRAKDQYRIFWSDGTGTSIFLHHKMPEITQFSYDITAQCAVSGEDSSGNEIMFFGDEDGFVYQIDKGNSYDGSEMTAILRLTFTHLGSPTINKRFHHATADIDAGVDTSLSVLAEYDYAGTAVSPDSFTLALEGGGGFWDDVDWDEFNWDGPYAESGSIPLNGRGVNISLAFLSQQTYEAPHTIHGMTIHYSERGLRRGKG